MKEKKGASANEKSNARELNPWPQYIQDRMVLWDKLKTQYDAELVAKPNIPIKVTLPDGKEIDGISWKTTVYDIAKGIRYELIVVERNMFIIINHILYLYSQGLADNSVISKVNGVLWDLDRPLEGDCKIQLLKFDDPEAQAVFWHSSAHILGEALERMYGGCLCYGPPIESGFYYDMHLEDKGVKYLFMTNYCNRKKTRMYTGCLL